MARSASRHPTNSELQILKILWAGDGPRSVRQVRDALAERYPPARAYTSVITLMSIMHRKRYLRRRKARDGGYLYTASVGEGETGRGMLRDLVDRVFRGSALTAVLHLLDERDLGEQELQQLRAMVNRRTRTSLASDKRKEKRA